MLCVGYLGDLIEERIGPSQFGIEISYSYDGPRMIGTLGAVRKAAPELGDRFLVLYGTPTCASITGRWWPRGRPAGCPR